MVFGRITVFAAAEHVATVITVITYYYCFYNLVIPPKLSIAPRLYCRGTAVMEVLLRSLYGATAVVLRRHSSDGGATAVIVRCHGGPGGAAAIMAVPWRSHYGLAQPAVALRKL